MSSAGGRGVFAGGWVGGNTNVIQYITISTPGNATDFGDLTTATEFAAACTDGERGVIGGGTQSSVCNVIEYITVASPGNATDFGDLLESRAYIACSSGT